jgi:hypothetical protein
MANSKQHITTTESDTPTAMPTVSPVLGPELLAVVGDVLDGPPGDNVEADVDIDVGVDVEVALAVDAKL